MPQGSDGLSSAFKLVLLLAFLPAAAVTLLTDLCETMTDGSLCALGGLTPYPVMSALTHFPDEFSTTKEAAE